MSIAKTKCNLRTGASILTLAGAMGLTAPAAYAACTADANNNVTCTGANTTPLTIYDQAAQFQPIAGSNAYTPANPAFPAATNPANPGYNPNPATEFVTIASGATFTSPAITAANRTTALTDSGLIAANYSNSENPAVNNVTLSNFGIVTLTNAQNAARASTIVADSQVNTFTVNNKAGGAIIAAQTTPAFAGAFNPALLTNTLTGTPPAAAAQYAGAAFAITSSLYSDDNTNSFVLNNAAGASVTASGHFATPYYGRADTTVTNSGTIANTDYVAGDSISAGHWALTAYAGTDYNTAPNTNPDSTIVIPNANGSVTVNDTSALTVTNKAGGTIKGDIVALDITPLVYAAAVGTSANQFANPTQAILNLPVSASNGGPRDSNIENFGTILGNFHLGSGTHVIDNAAGATVQGSVYVDQRPFIVNFTEPNAGTVAGTFVSAGGTDFNKNACPAAGQNTTDPGCATTSTKAATVVGGQSLTLTNEGAFAGDIRILDQATSVNSIALTGNGFNGNIVAVNGTGSNSLTLFGVSNLASVQNFSFLDLQRSSVTVANGVSLVNGAQINTTIFGPGGTAAAPSTNLGTIRGTLTLQGGTNITPVFSGIARNGDVYQLASTVTAAGAITVDKTALVSLTPSTNTGALRLQARVVDARALPGVTAPGAAALNGLTSYGGSNAAVQNLGAAVESFKSSAKVVQAANALSPIVNGADIQLPINSTLLFHQQIDARLDSFLYAQLPQSGRSADLGVPRPVLAAVPLNAAWVEGLDGGVHQSTVAGVNGYNADLTGVIGGYDHLIQPNLRVGAAFGFINADTNFNANLNGSRESIQTYQGLVYAEYAGPHAYLRGSVGDGGVTYHDTRQVAFNNFSDTATGTHNGNILTVRGEGGVPYEVGTGLVVPYAAITYNHLSQGGYAESSPNGAALTIAGVSNDSERAEVGGKVVVPIGVVPVFSRLLGGGVAVAVEAQGAYIHDFGNLTQVVTASFTGAGNVFVATGPTPSRDFFDGGVGLRLASGPVLFDLSYNALARSAYLQQVGLLKAKYLF